MHNFNIDIADFDYSLPEESIPKFPLSERESSKLMVFKNKAITDDSFKNIATHLNPNTQLVFNNTRVIQARILFFKPGMIKPIEIFCLEPLGKDVQQAMATKHSIEYVCLVGRAKKWKEGALEIELNGVVLKSEKIERTSDAYHIRFSWNNDFTFAEILELAGHTPLPPYLNRPDETSDKKRYQTVYAVNNGSVAAPTAGLHFTPSILREIEKEHQLLYATLHVGAGTFKPVQTDSIANHNMHFEEVHLKPEFIRGLLNHNGSRTAVGTTSVRTLESLYWLGVKALNNVELSELKQWEAYNLPQDVEVVDALNALLNHIGNKDLFFKTQLMIIPGYQFKMIDTIITNFHQPKSTLLLLVAAATKGLWRDLYNHAKNNNYRFLSYGDSSIIHV